MAVATFGITPETVRADFVPHIGTFTTSSVPSTSSVSRAILQAGARLAGLLDDRQVDTSSITDASSAAYIYCGRYIELWVAAHLLRAMPGANQELTKSWQEELASIEKAIDTQGAGALGPGATQTGTSEALGPADWISEGSLSVDSYDDWSGVEAVLRRDDQL